MSATAPPTDTTGGKSFLQADNAECGSPRHGDTRHPGNSSPTMEETSVTLHEQNGKYRPESRYPTSGFRQREDRLESR